MGAFGKEAIKLCKFLAEFGDESCCLQRIYQRLVGITANIECQVETLRRLLTVAAWQVKRLCIKRKCSV
jgi:hypothetical protein